MDLNQPITSETQRYCCIHVAAGYNHGHIIRGLAKLGADLNIEVNEHGYTPLTLALVLGHEWDAIELLKAEFFFDPLSASKLIIDKCLTNENILRALLLKLKILNCKFTFDNDGNPLSAEQDNEVEITDGLYNCDNVKMKFILLSK